MKGRGQPADRRGFPSGHAAHRRFWVHRDGRAAHGQRPVRPPGAGRDDAGRVRGLVILYILLLTAERIQGLLGKTGVDVLSRIPRLVLAALAVGILLNGLRASFFPLSSQGRPTRFAKFRLLRKGSRGHRKPQFPLAALPLPPTSIRSLYPVKISAVPPIEEIERVTAVSSLHYRRFGRRVSAPAGTPHDRVTSHQTVLVTSPEVSGRTV